MRRAPWHRPALSGALVACLGVAAAPVAADPTPERQAALIAMLDQDCGSCHGLTRKGGLGPSLLPAALAGKSDAALVAVILQGSTRQPMPPWGYFIDQEEAAWLVAQLRAGPSGDD
jgi:cytochrome c55X